MLNGVKSGSILLFHNDLQNTTEALPQLLTQLKADGYEFVTVSELIYWDDYSIDSGGMQIPNSQSSIDLTPGAAREVMEQYSEELSELGFTDDRLSQAAAAIKGGADIPDEIQEAISQFAADIGTTDADEPSLPETEETTPPDYYPDEITEDTPDNDFAHEDENAAGLVPEK